MNIRSVAIFSEDPYEHKFGNINICGSIPFKCECDYHLTLKKSEFLIIEADTISYIKSRLTEDAYLIPIVQEGRDDGVLETRLVKCTCGKLDIERMSSYEGSITKKKDVTKKEVILSDFLIETASSDDQPFGRIRDLIADKKMNEAMSLIVDSCAMSMYLMYLCTDNVKYLTLALTDADVFLTVKILIIIAFKSINDRKLAWAIISKIKSTENNQSEIDMLLMKIEAMQTKDINDYPDISRKIRGENRLYFIECKDRIDELEHMVGFYVGEMDAGRIACDKIMLNPISSSKDIAIQNIKCYAKQITCDMKRIELECQENYNATNPSMIADGDGYTMICRTVNYLYINGNWICQDGTGIINTINYLVKLDNIFNILSSSKIEVKAEYKRGIINRKIRGHEDARLFRHDGSLWYTCTTLDTSPTGIHSMSLCKLEDNVVTKLVPLLYKNDSVQKNYLPYSHNDKIHIIYGYAPFTILEVDENTGGCVKLDGFKNLQTKYHRGSTGPIRYRNPSGSEGYLIMIHNTNTNIRAYYQRFIWLDNKFIMRYSSTAFYFTEPMGLEFPNGMCLSNDGKRVIVSLGSNDAKAWIAQLEFSVIDDYLFTHGYEL